jgi:putative ABC transport system permease protein
MTIGVYITYRILEIADLTVEGSITLGASVSASMIAGGANPALATLCALAAGFAAGWPRAFCTPSCAFRRCWRAS